MKRDRIDLRVTTAEKDDIFEKADRLGLTISELIRQAVAEYQTRKRKKR